MKRYKSKIKMVIHQDAKALYKVGSLTADEMREFDEACLIKSASVSHPKRKGVVTSEIKEGAKNKVL